MEMNSYTIKQSLVSEPLPSGMTWEHLEGHIKKMAYSAKQRVIFADCGCLPGPSLPRGRIRRMFKLWLH